MKEKNTRWFQENSPIFNGLVSAIPQVCTLMGAQKGAANLQFLADGMKYNLTARANPEIISFDLFLSSHSDEYPLYQTKSRKGQFILGPHDLALFHLEDYKEGNPIEIEIDAITRPEMEGMGILHGFASSFPGIIKTVKSIYQDSLFGKQAFVVVEDLAKAESKGKNHSGLSGYLANQYGASFIDGKYMVEL